MSNTILYLASQSSTRHALLKLAGIPFQAISHLSNERLAHAYNTFEEHVTALAYDKMQHIVLPPNAYDFSSYFIMTADTLVKTRMSHTILGKPASLAHAHEMLELSYREPVEVVTAVCIEKRCVRPSKKGLTEAEEPLVMGKRIIVSRSVVEFCVPLEQRAAYFQQEPAALYASGAAVIEGYGLNFLKSLQGSFTGVLGLPLYEVRQALHELKFF